jgi:hypothetical protein
MGTGRVPPQGSAPFRCLGSQPRSQLEVMMVDGPMRIVRVAGRLGEPSVESSMNAGAKAFAASIVLIPRRPSSVTSLSWRVEFIRSTRPLALGEGLLLASWRRTRACSTDPQ